MRDGGVMTPVMEEPEESLVAIEQAVARHPGGASLSDVAAALPEKLADRTLQYRLKHLVDKGRLVKEGQGRRWTDAALGRRGADAAVSGRGAGGSACLPGQAERSAARVYERI